ncbi:MAG: hypothetical protein PUC82_00110 [bacterium]|nr:hypothetical protein [bacterium]
MNCPNCNKKMEKNFCMHCGYMLNGNFINRSKSEIVASDLELYLGKKFDIINRNINTPVIFFLGPLYFCFNKLVLLGVIAFILDILYYILNYFLTKLLAPSLMPASIFLSFILVRLFYVTCANLIYMKICKIKINKIKKKNPDNYRNLLMEQAEDEFSIMQLIIGILLILLLLAIIILKV